MSEDSVARLVFPAFKIGVDDPRDAVACVELGAGGFCLYNGRAAEIAELTGRLQAAAGRPLLFCGDYEDGLHAHCPDGTALPSNMGVGASGSEDIAFEKAAITAREARALGVAWVLAPVCDLATMPANPIVNVRAFSSRPEDVSRLAGAYLRGLKSEKALSCLKHFPGHGETVKDSHLELPALKVDRETLMARELAPFRALAGEADAVMTAHLKVPALAGKKGLPYSLSPDVARTLRGELGFRGLVSTDSLTMRAIADRFDDETAAALALANGSDILLAPPRPKELLRRLPGLVSEKPELAAAARAALRRLDAALSTAGPPPVANLSIVGCPEHRDTAARMAESCLAWSGPARALGGRRVLYWEVDGDPSEWEGDIFLSELKALGLEVEPYSGRGAVEDGRPLILGSFLSPRAYTGRIQYDRSRSARARKALAASPGALVASFGSPFVFAALGSGGLCAFSKSGDAQRAAAKALRGAIEVKGRLPV